MSRGTKHPNAVVKRRAYPVTTAGAPQTNKNFVPPDFSNLSPPPRPLEEAKRLAREYYPHYERLLWYHEKRLRKGAYGNGVKELQKGDIIGWLYECWVRVWTVYDPTRGSVSNIFGYLTLDFYRSHVYDTYGGRRSRMNKKTETHDHNYFRLLEKDNERPHKIESWLQHFHEKIAPHSPLNYLDIHTEERDSDWSSEVMERLGGYGKLETLIHTHLDAKTADVLLKSNEGKTLEEIGTEYGVVKERIRQVRLKGAKELRRLLLREGALNEQWLVDLARDDVATSFRRQFRRQSLGGKDPQITHKRTTRDSPSNRNRARDPQGDVPAAQHLRPQDETGA
jgi:hypothetical protein